MNKPNDWDNVQAFTDGPRLPAGSYICKVIDVQETTSSNGKDMIKIALDVLEGEHAGIFRKAFGQNPDVDKKWPCIVNQVQKSDDGKTSRGFKTFVTSVEHSNNTTAEWGDKFTAWCKGKKVGCLFHEEEYLKRDNTVGVSTKCFMFRSTENIDPLFIPPRKPLDAAGQKFAAAAGSIGGNDGAPDYTDDDVPF